MSQPQAHSRERVAGLDSLRFVCALLVVLGHGLSPPLMAGADPASHRLVWLLNGLVNNLYNGPAAVIVFFVLSGFCIHWPYREGRTLKVGDFLGRRLLRILLPLAVALGASTALGVKLLDFNDSILWSLFAEVIYYALYPLILPVARRYGFTRLVVGAFVLAAGVVLTQPNEYGNYPSYGLKLNWLLGLPCWLLGCWVAARVRLEEPEASAPSARRMWLWRLGIYGLTVVLSGLRFHSPLKYQHTLDFFAVAVAMYLAREIAASRHRPPPRWLERGGAWSYSLYLTHPLAVAVYALLHVPELGYFFGWAVRLGFVLGVSYVFSRAVERPAHLLAQRIGGPAPQAPQLSPASRSGQ